MEKSSVSFLSVCIFLNLCLYSYNVSLWKFFFGVLFNFTKIVSGFFYEIWWMYIQFGTITGNFWGSCNILPFLWNCPSIRFHSTSINIDLNPSILLWIIQDRLLVQPLSSRILIQPSNWIILIYSCLVAFSPMLPSGVRKKVMCREIWFLLAPYMSLPCKWNYRHLV